MEKMVLIACPNNFYDWIIDVSSKFGIGKKIASNICEEASIDLSKRVSELNDDELNKIRDLIDNNHSVEGDLRRKISNEDLDKELIQTKRGQGYILLPSSK